MGDLSCRVGDLNNLFEKYGFDARMTAFANEVLEALSAHESTRIHSVNVASSIPDISRAFGLS